MTVLCSYFVPSDGQFHPSQFLER